MIDWAELTLFLYITARISGFVLFNPVLGRRNIPGIFRSGLILVLSVFVISFTAPAAVRIPGSVVEMGLRILLELALGYLLGLVMNFFFYIPQLAGHAIDTQMGMTMNQVYDASAQANLSVSSVLLNTLMTLLFFAAGGHHTLLRMMLTSHEIVPFGAVTLGLDAANAMLELFVECTLLAVKLCMPILAAELLGQLGMGVLMKVIPQINVFSINIELKVIIGLGLLLLLMAPFSEFLLEAERAMLDSMHTLLLLL
ncbi:flagellar biosynthetic protein FliR [Oscillibacter sp.]|jgi:flagellar biosynthetic protein FliR|uniref:flagellar biosynthetic protein FliR n=1 Tax=Oscillibacter sp. TaxID=1945593 RepID=UPI0021706E49|nr:flagellar biosynthetic protein FliR [Oscillibacter sp.]MCI9647871.1 flagellar biosynthetic protein FliR [Oscillibacter sp.]